MAGARLGLDKSIQVNLHATPSGISWANGSDDYDERDYDDPDYYEENMADEYYDDGTDAYHPLQSE